jgi:hypothetical protein
MKNYIVYFIDAVTGAKSEIDNITVPEDYSPGCYQMDCDLNGCEWPDGDIIFQEEVNL